MALFTPAQIAYLRLLFQSRLRSLGAWAAGSYPQGSLVSHAGSLWLATGSPTTGTPGTDPEWVKFGDFTAITELPATAAMGALLYYHSSGWTNADTLLWDPTTVSGGQLTLDFSTAIYRSWDTAMPGIIFKQGTSAAGLFLNVEENDGSNGFAGGTYGNRLDMGWGGKGGGNFELYSMNHAERPGEFRVVYGGSGPNDAAADPPYGHIQFTHYAGDSEWRVKAGLSKEGRFSCGLNTYTYTAPSFPLEVYNEGESVALAVEKTGVIRGVASLATPPTALSANTFRLWMDSSDSQLKVTLADSTPTESTLILGLPATAPDGHVLTYTSGAWAAAAIPAQLPAGMIMPFAGSVAPSGWLVCDGALVSTTTYAALYAVIGDTYDYDDEAGEGEFKLPDLRGEFIRGWDGEGASARGVDTGRTFGSAQAEAINAHKHVMYYADSTAGAGTAVSVRKTYGTAVSGSLPYQTLENEDAGPETRPRNIALLYCIKT